MVGPGALEYKVGTLPENFHKRVVDMEIQLAIRGRQAADEAYAAQILELMSLYSVSTSLRFTIQAAIEFYNRELDEPNQTFYIEKMNSLNGQIKEVLDRQTRVK